jgi:hypothetical protein
MSFRSLVLAFLLPLCGACASTTWESTWRASDAGPVDYTGKRVATVFVSSEEGTRRAAEDALAAEVSSRGPVGVPSYTLLAAEDLQDEAALRAKLLDAGCEGALVMRITGEEQRVRATDPHYSSFSSYSDHGWGMAYAPAYVTTDTIVHAETLVYDLGQDKLLWAGTSRTFEPDRTQEFVVELAQAAAEEMRAVGLIR